jgi:hypothetical protein
MNFIYGLIVGSFLTIGEVMGGILLLPFLIAAFILGIVIFYYLSVWYDASLLTTSTTAAWCEYPWSWLPGASWVAGLMHALSPNPGSNLDLLAPSDSSVLQQLNTFVFKAPLAMMAAIINLTIIAVPVAMIFKVSRAAWLKHKSPQGKGDLGD